MMKKIFFGQKVVIMGLGLYEQGSGISAAKFFIQQEACVLVTDLKNAQQLAGPVKQLKTLVQKYPRAKLQFVLGRHRLADFSQADLIIRNPGVPVTSPYLIAAQKKKIPIFTDVSLFLKLYAGPVLGVTGTRGKSTVTTLLFKIVQKYQRQALLGGNLGLSPLLRWQKLPPDTPVVLEMSSWMTESLAQIKKSPRLAVVTNVLPDHLNTYKNFQTYAKAKEFIWRYQQENDIVVLNRDNVVTRQMGRRVLAQRFWVSQKYFAGENGGYRQSDKLIFRRAGREQEICRVSQLKVLGEHNVINVLTAASAALAFGSPLKIVRAECLKFTGLADRLELIRTWRGRQIFNDTTATSPDATLAALRALATKRKKIILIMGGHDKKLAYRELAGVLPRLVKKIIFLPGSGTEHLTSLLDFKKVPAVFADSMSKAVALAAAESQSGEVILLSPACASFGLFINEYDRGRQFKAAVAKLK